MFTARSTSLKHEVPDCVHGLYSLIQVSYKCQKMSALQKYGHNKIHFLLKYKPGLHKNNNTFWTVIKHYDGSCIQSKPPFVFIYFFSTRLFHVSLKKCISAFISGILITEPIKKFSQTFFDSRGETVLLFNPQHSVYAFHVILTRILNSIFTDPLDTTAKWSQHEKDLKIWLEGLISAHYTLSFCTVCALLEPT